MKTKHDLPQALNPIVGFNTGPLHSVRRQNRTVSALACVFRAVKNTLAMITTIVCSRLLKQLKLLGRREASGARLTPPCFLLAAYFV